jgi:plastocyanin
MHWKRRIVAGLAIAALGVACAACGSNGHSAAGSEATTAVPGGPVSRVTATETEYHIALSPSTFTAGRYAFVAKNAGTVTHALAVTGPGLSRLDTGAIAPGRSKTLNVTLMPGAYDLYCPIDGHKGLGMDVTIHVGTGAATAATTTTTPVTTQSSNTYRY